MTAVAIGGSLGATVRWSVITAVDAGQTFPWPVLLVNILGSFVLGAAMAEEWDHPRKRTLLHDGIGIGFCGGLTTFSTLAVETATMLRDEAVGRALVYLTASVLGAVLAAAFGAWLLRHPRAVSEPLEEQP